MGKAPAASIQSSTRSVQADERPGNALDRLSWDNLRLLLKLSEVGSFRKAARAAGLSVNTVRNRVGLLETQLGAPLVKRSIAGIELTQDGHEVVDVARRMRALGGEAARFGRTGKQRSRPRVKIRVTEGLGTFWIMPRVVEFQEAHPEMSVELECDMNAVDVLFRDIDVAVQLKRPKHPDLIIKRVGTLHLMLFAAERYLRMFGAPKSVTDYRGHKLVWQVADQVETDILPMLVDSAMIDSLISLQTNTSSAHYWAIAKGAGVGYLPTYARALSKRVIPIDIGLNLRRDIYIVHHPDAAKRPAVRAALDWLGKAFDKAAFPWFADEFIHPDAFEEQFSDSVVVNLFDRFDAVPDEPRRT